MINGDTYEKNASRATTRPAAVIGSPTKYPSVGCVLNLANRQAPARLKCREETTISRLAADESIRTINMNYNSNLRKTHKRNNH